MRCLGPAPRLRRACLLETHLDGLAVRRQVLGVGKRDDPLGKLAQGVLAVLDHLDGLDERVHAEAGRVVRATAGGQHVVRAGHVVAERDGRVRADEDRAGAPDRAVWTRSACLVLATRVSRSASTARASSSESVTSTDAAIGSCSAWLTRSVATCAGSAPASARMAISVGPASASIPTTPRTTRLAAAT